MDSYDVEKLIQKMEEKLKLRVQEEADDAWDLVSIATSSSLNPEKDHQGGRGYQPGPSAQAANMWEIPPTIQNILKEAPMCRCGMTARIFVTKKAGRNYERMFWRCPKVHHQRCTFFQWLKDKDQTLHHDTATGMDPQIEYLVNRVRETCKHLRVTHQGSNHFVRRTTCRDCGALLENQKTDAGKLITEKKIQELQKEINSTPPATPPRHQPPVTPPRRSNQHDEEYKEFLMWKQFQQNDPPKKDRLRSLFG